MSGFRIEIGEEFEAVIDGIRSGEDLGEVDRIKADRREAVESALALVHLLMAQFKEGYDIVALFNEDGNARTLQEDGSGGVEWLNVHPYGIPGFIRNLEKIKAHMATEDVNNEAFKRDGDVK